MTRTVGALAAIVATVVAMQDVRAQQTAAVVGIGPDGEQLRTDLEGLLRTAGLRVVDPITLSQNVERNTFPAPSDAVRERFAGFATKTAAGIEAFFYKGNQSAITVLQPEVEFALQHLEVVGARPDLAEQLYTAAVVLVRAHDAMGQVETRDGYARMLGQMFPTKRPSASTVPPDVVQLIEAERLALRYGQTSIQLEPSSAGECRLFLNGMTTAAGEEIHVAPEVRYAAQLDCGDAVPVVWSIRPREGLKTVVPITTTPPTIPISATLDDEWRRAVEGRLWALTHWGEVDVAVAVASHAGGAVLAAARGRQIRWSDVARSPSLERAARALFPEIEAEAAPGPPAQPTHRNGWGWLWAGGGLIAGGISAALFVSAEQDAARAACAPSGALFQRPRCDGVEDLGLLTASEYNRVVRAVRARRAAAAILAVLGAVGLGSGAFVLLRAPRAELAFHADGLRLVWF